MLNQVGSLAASSISSVIGSAGRGLSEFARRLALALDAPPEGVRAPPARLLLGEASAFSRRRKRVPECVEPALHPQPVMLLPGFCAHPRRMRPIFDALDQAGHEVEDWGLGFNLGPTPENFAYLMRRVRLLSRAYGAPVALIGWSLGGLFAREIACRQPENVARVITMGTPFSGDPRANNAWRPYQFLTGHAVHEPPIPCNESPKPPVPTIALWSPRDGVIHPRSAAGWPHERDRAIAMRCTHLGFADVPEVIAELLRQLDAGD